MGASPGMQEEVWGKTGIWNCKSQVFDLTPVEDKEGRKEGSEVGA